MFFKMKCVSHLLLLLCFCYVQCVEVDIELTSVPKYYTPLNDNLYIAGSFNGWLPNDTRYKLTRVSYNNFNIIIDLPLGTHEYKITRGSWDTVETASDGSAISNRVLQITSTNKVTLKLNILNWDDMKGTHTASGNTHMLDRQFPYPQFNTTKRIWIYLPPDYYTSTKTYPVIYMHDGQNIFDAMYTQYAGTGEWGVDETMEKYAQQGRTVPIVVGIETVRDRTNELTPYPNPTRGGGMADLYMDFILNNLKPYVDKNFRTKPEREFTGVGGSSHGGLASFYAGIKHQNTFSKLVVFSPSFWFNETIYSFAIGTPILHNDIRLYFACGNLEYNYPSMVSDMARMVLDLQFKGYTNVKSVILADGEHGEWFWKREFPGAFEYLFLS